MRIVPFSRTMSSKRRSKTFPSEVEVQDDDFRLKVVMLDDSFVDVVMKVIHILLMKLFYFNFVLLYRKTILVKRCLIPFAIPLN